MVDSAEVVDKVGDITDCFHSQGKVNKEILQVGRNIDKPKMGSLCRIKYIAYFYDKEIFDCRVEETPVDIYLGDIKLIEGMWRGIMEMRVGEKAKIKIKKKFAFGRPGEIDKLDFPPGFEAGEKREKLVSKNVIYEIELV
jgi:FKBP-type peptidyl-prolyl cis-trans isomerase